MTQQLYVWNLEFKLILYTLPFWDDFYQNQETHFPESFAVNRVINWADLRALGAWEDPGDAGIFLTQLWEEARHARLGSSKQPAPYTAE